MLSYTRFGEASNSASVGGSRYKFTLNTVAEKPYVPETVRASYSTPISVSPPSGDGRMTGRNGHWLHSCGLRMTIRSRDRTGRGGGFVSLTRAPPGKEQGNSGRGAGRPESAAAPP